MKRMILGTLATAVLSASAAAQSDQQPTQATQPTHAEQVQHWAEVGIDTQLSGQLLVEHQQRWRRRRRRLPRLVQAAQVTNKRVVELE